jgi:hypothetical protein
MLLPSGRARVVLRRATVAQPSDRAPNTFVCPGCDVILWDEVAYTHCPVCDLPVDWVDLALPVWCCPGCDAMHNRPMETTPRCAECDQDMVQADVPEPPREPAPVAPRRPPGRLRRVLAEALSMVLMGIGLLALLTPFLSLALDPRWRLLALALGAPLLVVPLVWAGSMLWMLGASFREVRDLARDRTTRIIHGLEHATAKVLEAAGHKLLGGLTHPGYFELYISTDTADANQAKLLRKAANEAIRRVRDGERSLALHPRCGTSLLVTILLLALVALGAAAVGFFMQLGPVGLLAIGGGFALVVVVGGRSLGLLAQRLLTVSTALRSARILRIERRLESFEYIRYDVHLSVRPRAG